MENKNDKNENSEINLTKELDIANKLADVLLDALEDKKQFNRYLIKGKEYTDEVIFDKVDMDSFNSALKALKALEELKRVMKESISPCVDNDGKTQTGIVILPEVKEENDES